MPGPDHGPTHAPRPAHGMSISSLLGSDVAPPSRHGPTASTSSGSSAPNSASSVPARTPAFPVSATHPSQPNQPGSFAAFSPPSRRHGSSDTVLSAPPHHPPHPPPPPAHPAWPHPAGPSPTDYDRYPSRPQHPPPSNLAQLPPSAGLPPLSSPGGQYRALGSSFRPPQPHPPPPPPGPSSLPRQYHHQPPPPQPGSHYPLSPGSVHGPGSAPMRRSSDPFAGEAPPPATLNHSVYIQSRPAFLPQSSRPPPMPSPSSIGLSHPTHIPLAPPTMAHHQLPPRHHPVPQPNRPSLGPHQQPGPPTPSLPTPGLHPQHQQQQHQQPHHPQAAFRSPTPLSASHHPQHRHLDRPAPASPALPSGPPSASTPVQTGSQPTSTPTLRSRPQLEDRRPLAPYPPNLNFQTPPPPASSFGPAGRVSSAAIPPSIPTSHPAQSPATVSARQPLARINSDSFRPLQTSQSNQSPTPFESGIKPEFGRVFSGLGAGSGSGASSRRQSPMPQPPPPPPPIHPNRPDQSNMSRSRSSAGVVAPISFRSILRPSESDPSRSDLDSSKPAPPPTGPASQVVVHPHHHHHHPPSRNERRPHHHHLTPHHHHHHHHHIVDAPAGPAANGPQLNGALPRVPHHHHYHLHHHHHQHPHTPGLLTPQPVPPATSAPKPAAPPTAPPALHQSAVDADFGELVKSVASLPRKNLGSCVYSSRVVPPNRQTADYDIQPPFGLEHDPIPDFRRLDVPDDGTGLFNCTYRIRVPRYYLRPEVRQVICRERRLWGTHIFTDDSDPLACAIHAGFVVGNWGSDVSVPELVKLGAWLPSDGDSASTDRSENDTPNPAEARKRKRDTEASATVPAPVSRSGRPIDRADGPQEPPANADLMITLLILPPLDQYPESVRFGIKSREWDGNHDGLSFHVLACDWIDGRSDVVVARTGQARRERLRVYAAERDRWRRQVARMRRPLASR